MDAMPLRVMWFWVFITIFGSGLFVIFEQHVIWGTAMIVVGLIGIVSCAWPQLRNPVSGRIQIWNYRLYRKAATGLVLAYLGISAIAYVHSLRSDLDTYVIPRSISKKQANDLRDHLSRHEAHAVSVKVNPRDAEALEYAAELFNAVRQGSWDADFNTSDGQPYTSDGLCTLVMGSNIGPPDPKHDPKTLLLNGFQAAHIEANCGGSIGAGDYKLFTLVGHRPLKVGDQETTLYKVGHWIERLGQ